MWLEEPRGPPLRPWAPPWPSAPLHPEGCPTGLLVHCAQLEDGAVVPQRRPWSLEEFSRRSTLHGIQHIFQHHRFTARNLLWLLAFLSSLALLVHVYTKCVGLYFQYPHSTQLEEATDRNKTFPAVTLCNLNPARFSQLSGHDLYWAGEMLGLLDGAGQPLMHEVMERDALAALRGKLDLSEEEKSRPFDFVEFVERVSHRLELGEMLVRCTFGGKECSSSDFQTVSAIVGGQVEAGMGHLCVMRDLW